MAEQDRSTPTEKGSLLIFPHVEVRWNNAPPYSVIQDTFLHLTNDYPAAVGVKMFFVNGDPPLIQGASDWGGDDPVEPAEIVGPVPRHFPDLPPGMYSRTNDGDLSLDSGEHGIAVSIGLTEPRCEGRTILGTLTAEHNDGFGDTTEVRDAFVTVRAAAGDVRVPAVGNLEIVAVSGNTTALVGGGLPILIGPGGSFLSGLPGLAGDGEVTFEIVGYEIQPADPDPLRVFGSVRWRDLCDDPGTAGCDDTEILEAITVARNDVLHPRITLDKIVSDVDECVGTDRQVTYTYAVENTGNAPFETVDLSDAAPCGTPTFIGGDDNFNGILDPDEIWTYECVGVVAGGTDTMATVTGLTANPGCDAMAQDGAMVPLCDPPPEEERDHPGWNLLDNLITLTASEPAYWSAATGLPKGVSPWHVLDPGPPGGPGRVDPNDPTQRYLRGFVVAFAVQQAPVGDEIRWNHLAGDGTIVNYREENAWQYGAPAFQVSDNFAHGAATGTPGDLFLDGNEYAQPGQILLMNFIASASDAYSGPGFPVTHDTQLTMMPVYGDFRQETTGPRTAKATFDIWNQNEVKFTNLDQCVTCWSSELVSRYAIPNHFHIDALHTDAGKARIDGVTSLLCAPENALATPLVGVSVKLIDPRLATGNNLFDLGFEDGMFQYDAHDPPPESRWDPADILNRHLPPGTFKP